MAVISSHFGLNKRIEGLIQSIFLGAKLISDIKPLENGLLLVKLKEETNYSLEDLRKLLTYLLDLIRFFSLETCHLVRDTSDPIKFYLLIE